MTLFIRLFKKLLNTLYLNFTQVYEEHNYRKPTSHQLELLMKAEEALKSVVIPGYDVNLVYSGIVKKLRLTGDGKLLVYLDYTGSDPHCNFCRFINWQLWRKILVQAEDALRRENIPSVIFVDWATNARIEYR